MPQPLLNATERGAVLTSLPLWREVGTGIERDFTFANFNAAWGFMSRVALVAERQDHHPDWSNSYKRVHIALTTHDAGGLTVKDHALAVAIDRIAAALLG